MGSYGHEVHTNLSSFLNNVQYPCEVPLYYLDKPDAIEDGDIKPFFPQDANDKVMSRITIAGMVDMVDKVVPFRILRDDDIITIYTYLDEYIWQTREYDSNAEVAEYAKKAKALREQLRRSIMILAKRLPQAKKIINRESLTDHLKFDKWR